MNAGRRLSRDGPRAGGAEPAGHRPRAQGIDHPARHRRAGLHHPAPHRRPLPDDARAELEHKMAWCCWAAGRLKQLVFGELSTGAADDLAKVTDIARDMVTRYGMDPGLGHETFDARRPMSPETAGPWGAAPRSLSEETMRRIDAAQSALMAEAFTTATAVLTRHRAILERGAQALLEHETLDEEALRDIAGSASAGRDEPS
jgi:cell division protease FtsH